MSGRLLTIYTARSRKASLWSRAEYTWQELCDRLMSFAVTSETLDEYLSFDRERQTKIKDVGGFVGGTLRGGIRKKANLTLRSLVTLDFDGFTPAQLTEIREQFPGVAWAVYSTHKHRCKECVALLTPAYQRKDRLKVATAAMQGILSNDQLVSRQFYRGRLPLPHLPKDVLRNGKGKRLSDFP